MIQEFKKVWKQYTIGMLWLLGLLWPLLGIHPDGTMTFQTTFTVWTYILAGSFVCLVIYVTKVSGALKFFADPISRGVCCFISAWVLVSTWWWVWLVCWI